MVTSDLAKGRPTSIKDALNRTTSYQYDANGRMTRVTLPEGNYTQFTYDSRGNVTQARSVSKTPGTPADIVSTASYDATCTNPVKCNEPNSRTDARGNVTDYTYDTTHGAVTSVTRPAPTGGAVRPQTRYSYTLVNGEYQLTGVSQCQTLASCANAADETKTTLTYDVYGNVLTSISGNGTGSLTATQAMTYDTKGDVITVDGPLLGADDTTRIRYDAARRVTGVIAPDPDGAGTLKHRAIRTTLDVAGRVTRQELGTIPGPNPDWANFTSVEAVDVTYDGSGARVATRKLSGGGTAFAMTQSSYDALGRPECSAIRMNPAIYGSLPASACTLGTQGSFGPDRIAKTIYDAAGQVMQRQVAVGTGDVATEATLTYTSNGKLQTLKDAENNLTTYLYDGFDRLKETQYPSATKGSGTSNPADNEVLSYDANSNVTNRRLRDDTGIAFTYDALNRVTLKNLPSGEANVTYAYDNLGRLTSAVQSSQAHSFTYDALSRNLTETGPRGTMTSAWDIAGRRSRLTWPDGFWVDYDYLVTGEMTKVRENDATSGAGVLATFAYDILGRRTSLTRGNGAVTSYGYDPVSRLATLAENFTGSTNDQSSTFTYSPASQIGGVTRTNTAFAWTEHGSGSTASVANGLNQLASIGGAATTHDARGNLTGDPTTGKTYTYTAENRLTNMSSAAGGVNLYYDPLGRLRQMSGGPITDLYLQHDGIQLATEYRINDGAMLKRYVFGPGIDQPLVEYDLAGTRTWLHADERGSVIALSDNSGNVTTINRYDEYGRPQSTNLGRFQYTGQAWLKEIGVYYYKARMYDPALGGRFLQTDPIGPAGGINPYAYVGNDPVNWIDPLGLRWVCVTGPGVDPSTGDVDPGSEVTTCGDNSDPFFDSEVAPLSWTFPRSREFRFTRAGRVNVALAPQQFKIVIVPVQCSSTTSTLGHIAREAGEIADATMGLAFVSGALGLATSETGVGGLTFGGIAVGLGLVSGFASAVQVGAETIDGNRRAATRHALGLTVEQGTSATLSAASKQFGGPGTRLASQAVGQIYGRAISSVTCGM